MTVIIENEKILKSLKKTILGVLNIYLKTEQKGPTNYRHTCSLNLLGFEVFHCIWRSGQYIDELGNENDTSDFWIHSR